MTPDEIREIASRTRLEPRAIRLATLILCDGLSAREAGRREGVSGQTANAAARRILNQLRQDNGYPSDWQYVSGFAPPEVAAEIYSMLERARRNG